MRRLRTLFLLGALTTGPLALATPAPSLAQSRTNVAMAESWPEADPSDVESVDSILTALYDVISGPAGQARDWDRFCSLFIPEARLIPTGRSLEGEHRYQAWSPGEYAEQEGDFLEQNGFFAREVARTEERFGPVVHAFSTYDPKRNADDPERFARGINSIQLMHDDDRWYVVTIYWAVEQPDLPIPGQYLPSTSGVSSLEERVEKLEEQVTALTATQLLLADQLVVEQTWNVARFARLRNTVCRVTVLTAGEDPDQMSDFLEMCEDGLDQGLERDFEALRSTGGSNRP
ncbi:MAG: hypothetical protein OXI39_08675 [Gemmatimonadota bacterium]|uniref:hypothetical protein n=1 Tax=Candidatus Palauibacter scopulicola TaxID=3056741 RepID=UPI0023A09B34|nr:hypothetical protein [Candidatus Palauibacter scopulicola]MDE2663062.1 hypothetical protein [Candidatus Palauibacter scopulicola]